MDNTMTDNAKAIDAIYKNLLESFNPSTRQMINAAKAYLKALHGSSAASSLYLDSLHRLAKQANQLNPKEPNTEGNEIGPSLIQITQVFKELHQQQLATLKSFYVDFILPLETNLEKDGRVLQSDLKKFHADLKHRQDSYTKAVSTVKKISSKKRPSSHQLSSNHSHHLDREIRGLQNMEEERSKIDSFIENSLKDATLQSNRRYGFILERQSSLAKHYVSLYSKGCTLIQPNLEKWTQVAKDRDMPTIVQPTECIYCSVVGKKKEAKAIYPFNNKHLETNNQLSFNEGDTINVLGPINKGWQYGENTRTSQTGWFPIAYISQSNETVEEHTPLPSVTSPNPNPPPPPAPMMIKPHHKDFSSSNDSGISDQQKLQPEIDYSEDDDDDYQRHSNPSIPTVPPPSSYHHRRQPSTSPSRTTVENYTSTWLQRSQNHHHHQSTIIPTKPLTRAQSFNSVSSGSDKIMKKIIQRTKSLIWKNNNKPNDMGTPWASHESIIVPHFETANEEDDEQSVFSSAPDEFIPPPPPPMPTRLASTSIPSAPSVRDISRDVRDMPSSGRDMPPSGRDMPLMSRDIAQLGRDIAPLGRDIAILGRKSSIREGIAIQKDSSAEPVYAESNNKTINTTINQTIILNSDSFKKQYKNSMRSIPAINNYQKSERTGNLNGPWYDLWGEDNSIYN